MIYQKTSKPMEPGQRLRLRYEIIKQIGEGGFADTYLARDHDIPTTPDCVVKRLKQQDPRISGVAVKMFDEEAQKLHELGQHSQIPELKAHFKENDSFFLVQQYINGHDLRNEIIPGRPWNERETIKLLIDILEVLSFVHQKNLIHRDLKPANIMRRQEDGNIVLIDFGSVKQVNGLAYNSSTGLTSLTVAIGTPGYMPAEQANGRPKLASDVYAVGIIALEALTGLHPQAIPKDDQTDELLWRNPRLSISNELGRIIDKMVVSYSPNRYKNAMEVLKDLKILSGGWSSPTPTPIPVTRLDTEIAEVRNKLHTTIITNTKSLSHSQGFQTFSFETVTVNKSGRVIKRENKTAKYCTVDLGNEVTMDFVAIPGGSFIMGSRGTEKGRADDEGPEREVTVASFFMGKYPVTQAQYQQLMNKNPSSFKGQDLPVEQVNWDNSLKFCQELSKKTGKNFTLPSEAQWEYACRAGTTTPFYFGETITSELANYSASHTYGDEPKAMYIERQTIKVGFFPPNAFGLYGMHGNVWEWCLDNYHYSYEGAWKDATPWSGGDRKRIVRGGSWINLPDMCRSATRYRLMRRDFGSNIGFRVVFLVT